MARRLIVLSRSPHVRDGEQFDHAQAVNADFHAASQTPVQAYS
jgi:hypothetical protein